MHIFDANSPISAFFVRCITRQGEIVSGGRERQSEGRFRNLKVFLWVTARFCLHRIIVIVTAARNSKLETKVHFCWANIKRDPTFGEDFFSRPSSLFVSPLLSDKRRDSLFYLHPLPCNLRNLNISLCASHFAQKDRALLSKHFRGSSALT